MRILNQNKMGGNAPKKLKKISQFPEHQTQVTRKAGGGRYVENRGVTAGMDGAKYVIKLSELLSSQHQRRVSVYIRNRDQCDTPLISHDQQITY